MKAVAGLLPLVLLTSTACATFRSSPPSSSRVQAIFVTSTPAGASVVAECGGSETKIQGTTPCELLLTRRLRPCRITASLRGYETLSLTLEHQVRAAFVGNLVLPLITGAIAAAISTDREGWFSGREWDAAAGVLVGIPLSGLGMAVDGTTGAIYEHIPRAVQFDLQKSQEVRVF